MSPHILLIEDEPGLSLTITDLLTADGYRVDTARDGTSGLAKASDSGFDLVILDVMLPGKSGFDVCRELRQHGCDTAILMLTARTQVSDRIVGLRLGADDYLLKPFNPSELLARVDALLRRVHRKRRTEVRHFEFLDVVADFVRGEVRRAGQVVPLAAKELQLLQYLIDHRNMVVTREDLLENVWEYSGEVSSRTVDVHISWLRQKLEPNPQSPQFIRTVRGIGYQFTCMP